MSLLKLIYINFFFLAKVELYIFLMFSTSSSTSISELGSSVCKEAKNFSVFDEKNCILMSEMSKKIENILILSLLIL